MAPTMAAVCGLLTSKRAVARTILVNGPEGGGFNAQELLAPAIVTVARIKTAHTWQRPRWVLRDRTDMALHLALARDGHARTMPREGMDWYSRSILLPDR